MFALYLPQKGLRNVLRDTQREVTLSCQESSLHTYSQDAPLEVDVRRGHILFSFKQYSTSTKTSFLGPSSVKESQVF